MPEAYNSAYFAEGFVAFDEGLNATLNPYPPQTSANMSWKAGWTKGWLDYERVPWRRRLKPPQYTRN